MCKCRQFQEQWKQAEGMRRPYELDIEILSLDQWVNGEATEYDTNDWLKMCYNVTHSFSRERERERERESESENSQIVNFLEKPTSGAKNRSNTSRVANFFSSEKMIFFFKNFAYFCFFEYMHISSYCLKNAQIPEIFLNFFYRSLYNRYFKGFFKKFLKKTAKEKLHICKKKKKKKKLHIYKNKKKFRLFRIFFQRITIIMNVLDGPEVGVLINALQIDISSLFIILIAYTQQNPNT
ncbi:hypothetical protein LXL04_030828 [Taraxacum kok-saghyz]